MDAVTPIALLSLVVFTLLNLVRFLRGALAGQGWNGVITIIASWVIGVIAAALFGASDIGADLIIPGFTQPLGDMGLADLILVGLVVASGAGAFNEVRGALDSSSSTTKPTLLPGSSRRAEN